MSRKKLLLEKHPLLAVPAAGCKEHKAARQNAMKFYNHLDLEHMPMDVAKALGPGKARVVIKQLGNMEEPSPTQKIENEKNTESNSNIINNNTESSECFSKPTQ